MSVVFRSVRYARRSLPEIDVDFELLGGVLYGLTGPNGSGKTTLMELAAGLLSPEHGKIERTSIGFASRSFFSGGPESARESIDAVLEAEPEAIAVGPGLALTDPAYQRRTLSRLHQACRRGATAVVVSHDLNLLERHADEVLLMRDGRIVDRGAAAAVLRNYRSQLLEEERNGSPPPETAPAERHGDGRAELTLLELVASDGACRSVLKSGEETTVRTRFRFHAAVDDPVVGILIRSRIGVNVYGTNTELEGLHFGPCEAGQEVGLRFEFRCDLCPGEYTLTVASHDPDGIAHDWLDDAVVFTVEDTRYTAGVANLRAQVEVE